jgi:lactobin A/cerein 7B family class IIb bacteriocin
MENSNESKEMAEKLGIDTEKVDFTLQDKELEDVSGGAGPICTEIGVLNPNCTSAGFGSGCSEIGLILENCTNLGV